MKKLLAVFLTIAMLSMLCMTSVFAAGSGMGDSSTDVFIKIDDDIVIHQYSVDVEFGDMKFIYGATAIWDSELHDYVFSEDPVWMPESQNGDRILLRNHSDSPVTYTTSFDAISDKYGTIALEATPASGQIEKCPIKATDAPEQILTISLDGAPATFTEEFVSLAKVIVTIAKVNEPQA